MATLPLRRFGLTIVALCAAIVAVWAGLHWRAAGPTDVGPVASSDVGASGTTKLDPANTVDSSPTSTPSRSHAPATDASVESPGRTPSAEGAADALLVEVHSNGELVGGVPVRLEVRDRRVGDWVTLATATSGLDGSPAVVSLAELRDRTARMRGASSVERRIVAGIAGAGIAASELPSDLPTGSRVRVEIGPTGALEVRLLEPDGTEVRAPCTVECTWRKPANALDEPGIALIWRQTSEGRTRMGPVPVGSELELSATRDDRLARTTESRRVTLSTAQDAPVIDLLLAESPVYFGVVRVEDGTVVRDTQLAVTLLDGRKAPDQSWVGKPTPAYLSVTTDAEGRFELPLLGQPVAAGRVRVMRLEPSQTGSIPRGTAAELELPDATDGSRVDLGEITLRAPDEPIMLVAGHVLDPDRHAIADPRFDLEVRANSEERWSAVAIEVEHDPQSGAFALRGARVNGELSLRVSAPGHAPEGRRGLAAGAAGVDMVLARSKTLLARILLDPSVSPLLLHVTAEGVRSGRDLPLSVPLCKVTELAPEPVTVRILTQDTNWLVAEIREVDAGADGIDPRLDPLDLRDAVRLVSLEVQAPDGRPWSRKGVWVHDSSTRRGGRVTSDAEGHLVFALPSRCEKLVLTPELGDAEAPGSIAPVEIAVAEAQVVRFVER